jgi:NADH-quinone oxidoreductase subunit A
MLFILFDVETAFFYPWALVMDTLGIYGLMAMGTFFLVLAVGFVYEWKVGAMDW